MRRETNPDAFPVWAYDQAEVGAWALSALASLDPHHPLASQSLHVGAALCDSGEASAETFAPIRGRALDLIRGGEDEQLVLAAVAVSACLEQDREVTEALALRGDPEGGDR